MTKSLARVRRAGIVAGCLLAVAGLSLFVYRVPETGIRVTSRQSTIKRSAKEWGQVFDNLIYWQWAESVREGGAWPDT